MEDELCSVEAQGDICSLAEAKLAKGKRFSIVAVDEKDEHASRLIELGLSSGSEIVIEKVAPFGDPIEISVRGSSFCLRRSESAHVFVRGV